MSLASPEEAPREGVWYQLELPSEPSTFAPLPRLGAAKLLVTTYKRQSQGARGPKKALVTQACCRGTLLIDRPMSHVNARGKGKRNRNSL